MVVTAGGMASLVILGLIALFLSIKGVHILVEEKFGFITGSAWEVITDETGAVTQSNFGIGAMLIGTMLSAVIAISVGVPISVLSALYLTFYANGKVKKYLISVIDLMAAFPSLLFGFWGFFSKLAGVLGQPVFGLLAAWLGYRAAILANAGFFFLGLLVLLPLSLRPGAKAP